MAPIQLVKVQSRVFTAKCSEPQVVISDGMLVDIANALEVSSDELLVDNLEVSSSSNDSDIHYLLLDCSKEEQQFITKVIKSLRDILRTYSLK